MNVVLYGAGKRCDTLCALLAETEINVVAILDISPDKIGQMFHGKMIEPPGAIGKYSDCDLCITIGNMKIAQEVREILADNVEGIDLREISYRAIVLQILSESKEVRNYVSSLDEPVNTKISNLFVCYDMSILGGVEAWAINVSSGLLDMGMDNIYILSDYNAGTCNKVLDKQILRMHEERKFSSEAIIDIMQMLYEHMPCQVITRHSDEYLVAAYLLKKRFPEHIKVITGIRSWNEWIYAAYMDFRACTDIYVAVSKGIKREMVQRGISENIIYTMTVPFQCDVHLERGYTLDDSQPLRVGYAGRLDGFEKSQKRMDLLLYLIDELARRQVPFMFDIAGDGVAREGMEQFIGEHRLNDRVRFLGRLSKKDIPDFWKHQDICVNMADYEGRSISIAEAMGHGAVPVVTDTSGVRDDIVDGENGYIVPIGDYKTAAERIEQLATRRQLLPQMGMKAHDAVYPTSLREPHLKFWQKLLLEMA